jgi:hypothetical protein
VACNAGWSCVFDTGAEKEALTMEWQPIETAPKDGTPVLGYRDGDMATVEWRASWGEWVLVVPRAYAEDDEWKPSHWMPLPDPPPEPSP